MGGHHVRVVKAQEQLVRIRVVTALDGKGADDVAGRRQLDVRTGGRLPSI